MPGKNIYKEYVADSFYHVYSRGVAKQAVFIDDTDYSVFLSLLKRYLRKESAKSSKHGEYANLSKQIELLAYCLMTNHFHLLIFQKNINGMKNLMKSVLVSYSMYFNKKYKRVGPVFQSRYKASRIQQDDYLDHITRYIHLNPRDWESYPYSSLKYYRGDAVASWIHPGRILELFPSSDEYIEFVRDYKGYKDTLDEIHWDLADQ